MLNYLDWDEEEQGIRVSEFLPRSAHHRNRKWGVEVPLPLLQHAGIPNNEVSVTF